MSERVLLAVDRASFGEVDLRSEPLTTLADGHVRLRVDHVAITANTVTYAQFGDLLGYWDFYPLDTRWGSVPAVGWATVTESRVDGITGGLHLYGWFPMATTVDLRATPTRDGVRDDAPHRSAHAPTYRAFVARELDPMYTGADDEERHSLLRVLYLTGFLIASFFETDEFAAVEQSIVMSASSKTAIGYAWAARRAREHGRHAPQLVGVTSQANLDFVRALDLYDDVISYEAVGTLPERPAVVVDMAGAGDAVAAIHTRLGDRIAHSMIVGKSHAGAVVSAATAGPPPALFFAPAEVERRLAEWGPAEYWRRLTDGVAGFIAASERWMSVERRTGPAAFADAWQRAVRGEVPPHLGVVASMHP